MQNYPVKQQLIPAKDIQPVNSGEPDEIVEAFGSIEIEVIPEEGADP